MKRFLWLLAVAGLVLLSATPLPAQDFYVVATRYNPGTPITSLPYTIPANAPGYY